MTEKKIAITDVVLRDAHQSLFATRLRLDDMLPIASALDEIGFWSLEAWGGATFDACIRFLGEDPWQRLRTLKKAMPKTPLQMLLRGQNLLGYRHYADDVVEAFVARAVESGVSVFRVFDALNDARNMKTALQAVRKNGGHAQGTLSYTTSPVHTLETWLTLTDTLQEIGIDSLAIKDMAGILKPYEAYELITAIKARHPDLPIHVHCHSTAGLAPMTLLKAVEAGAFGIDTAISSMSGTYGHPATESLVATLENTGYDTGLSLVKLQQIADYFREVRKKYHAFEGQLKGSDSRILLAQVPGGMLTNLENQLKQQNASDRFDAVLEEIPRVRKDLGYLPLVTPTSQIVGTQAVINVLSGTPYQTLTKETAAVLRGEYGKTPAPVDAELQARALNGEAPVTVRPADKLAAEMAKLTEEAKAFAKENNLTLSENPLDDTLSIALFGDVAKRFLQNKHNPEAFEPVPSADSKTTKQADKTTQATTANADAPAVYTVTVEGRTFVVGVQSGGDVSALAEVTAAAKPHAPAPAVATAPAAPTAAATNPATTQQASSTSSAAHTLNAPMAGNILKILVEKGQQVSEGQPVLLLEAMKMETEVSADKAGVIGDILVKAGDVVAVGDALIAIH